MNVSRVVKKTVTISRLNYEWKGENDANNDI
jgi:hypothetical protein